MSAMSGDIGSRGRKDTKLCKRLRQVIVMTCTLWPSISLKTTNLFCTKIFTFIIIISHNYFPH